MRIRIVLAAIAVFAPISLGPVAAFGDTLPILNPSFEQISRSLEIGEQSNGAGGVGVPVATRFPFAGGGVSWENPVEVAGWRTRTRPPGDTAVNYAGVLNPPLRNGQPFVTGQDGTNVCAVQVSQIGQMLDARWQPNTRYRLEFLGGIGLLDSDYQLALSLIAVDGPEVLPIEGQAGVSRVSLFRAPVPADSFGTMLPYSFEFTSPEVLPTELAGRFVGIQMYGSDGFPRVLYDAFALDATPVPEPTGLAILALAAISRIVVRRR